MTTFNVQGDDNIVYMINDSSSATITTDTVVNPRACLTLNQVKQKLENGFVQLVDVRGPPNDSTAFQEGSIPNAINVP